MNLLKVPHGKRDEVYVLLSDILPTAWHANELGQVGEGDRVAIWGAGPGACLPVNTPRAGLSNVLAVAWCDDGLGICMYSQVLQAPIS